MRGWEREARFWVDPGMRGLEGHLDGAREDGVGEVTGEGIGGNVTVLGRRVARVQVQKLVLISS